MPVMVRPAQGQDWYEFSLAKHKSHVYVSARRYWLRHKSGSNLKEELASIDFGGKSRLIDWPDLNPQMVQSCHPSTRKRSPTQTPMHTHTDMIITSKTRKSVLTISTTYCSDSILFCWKSRRPDIACEAISSDAPWREFTSFTLARRGKSWWWQLECSLDPTLGSILSASCFYGCFLFLVIPCFTRLLSEMPANIKDSDLNAWDGSWGLWPSRTLKTSSSLPSYLEFDTWKGWWWW